MKRNQLGINLWLWMRITSAMICRMSLALDWLTESFSHQSMANSVEWNNNLPKSEIKDTFHEKDEELNRNSSHESSPWTELLFSAHDIAFIILYDTLGSSLATLWSTNDDHWWPLMTSDDHNRSQSSLFIILCLYLVICLLIRSYLLICKFWTLN